MAGTLIAIDRVAADQLAQAIHALQTRETNAG